MGPGDVGLERPAADGRQERMGAGCCVLPSGRVAVVGGADADRILRSDGAAFDPEAQTWQPLPPMAHARSGHGVVAVAGGLLAVGVAEAVEDTDDEDGEDEERPLPPAELFDEASGRWFALPHPMAEPRSTRTAVVSLPAAALAPPAQGAEAGAEAAAAQ